MKKTISKQDQASLTPLISTQKIKEEYPELEDMMFKNKNAIKSHKKKQNYKNKPK